LSVPVQRPTQGTPPQSGLTRPQAVAVWGLWLLSALIVALGVAGSLPGAVDVISLVDGLAGSVAALSLATSGAILVTRLPGNRVGLLLWVAGVLLGLAWGASSPAVATLPGNGWLVSLADAFGLAPIVLMGVALPLLFPTGHLPSPRWRAVMVVATVAAAIAIVQTVFSPFSPGSAPPGVSNPLAVGGAMASVLSLMASLAAFAAFVCFPLAAVSLAVRYRRASGAERAQLRWFAAVASLIGISFVVAIATGNPTGGLLLAISNVAWLSLFGGLALMPVAIGIAVLRYRLYEIDRIISRTVTWAVASGVLLVVFAGAILLFQAVFAPLTGDSTVAVAASTLAVAALFQPLRRRVQWIVDRRFNRAHINATRTVDAFGGRLRGDVDLEQLSNDVSATVTGTLQPAFITLWLRGHEGSDISTGSGA
jgi:hypothetical protein